MRFIQPGENVTLYFHGSRPQVTFSNFLPPQVEEGHGSWAAEDSVPAEERQEGGGEEERSGRRPENCRQGCARPQLPRLPGKYWPIYSCSTGELQHQVLTKLGLVEEVLFNCYEVFWSQDQK